MIKKFLKSKDKKNVLLFVSNINIIENCSEIISQNTTSINYYACSPNNSLLPEFNNSEISNLENLYVVDFNDIIFKVEIFGLVISSITHAAYNNKLGIKILPIFKKLEIPIIELQHGFIQYGLNYLADNENYKRIYDFGYCNGWADHVLTYFDINNEKNFTKIGYPKQRKNTRNIESSGYILILTNFNWDIYSFMEISNFYSFILRLFIDFPDQKFIFKVHPAEVRIFKEFYDTIETSFDNVIISHRNNIFNLIKTEKLIQSAFKVISTISTTLLDCELYSKQTIIYKCKSNSEIFSTFQKVITFSDYTELVNFINSKIDCKIRTGYLNQYDNEAYIGTINKMYKETCKKELIPELINQYFIENN